MKTIALSRSNNKERETTSTFSRPSRRQLLGRMTQQVAYTAIDIGRAIERRL